MWSHPVRHFGIVARLLNVDDAAHLTCLTHQTLSVGTSRTLYATCPTPA